MLNFEPSPERAAMMATDIPPAISAYPIAVAPLSSRTKRARSTRMVQNSARHEPTAASQSSTRFDIVALFAKIARNSSPLGVISKRADRKIAQPQIRETTLLPDSEYSPIECQAHRIVTLLHRDAHAFAEIAAVDVGTTAKSTAIFGIGSIEPEGERDCIAEQEIDFAAPQGEPRCVGARIGANLGLGKQSLKIGLVRGAGGHRDLLALEPLRQRIFYG